MSNLVVTNPTLSNPANKTQVEQNFTDVAAWANGNIDNTNLSTSAGIAVTKLAAYYQETYVTLTVNQYRFTAAGWPAVAATTPLAWCPVPYSSASDEAWTVTDISWTCDDTGDGAGQFDVRYGYYNAAAWTLISAVSTGNVMANGAAANDANDGRISGLSASLAVPNPIDSRHLAIMSAAVSATTLTATDSQLNVTVRLRRKIQAA